MKNREPPAAKKSLIQKISAPTDLRDGACPVFVDMLIQIEIGSPTILAPNTSFNVKVSKHLTENRFGINR